MSTSAYTEPFNSGSDKIHLTAGSVCNGDLESYSRQKDRKSVTFVVDQDPIGFGHEPKDHIKVPYRAGRIDGQGEQNCKEKTNRQEAQQE